MQNLLKEPLLFFFCIAGGIFALNAVLDAKQSSPIVLTPAVKTALAANFEGLTGRPATDEERAQLEKDYVMDELFLREAVSRGLHLSDSQTRQHLSNTMRRLYTGTIPQPSEETLLSFYADNIEDYRSEPSITFRHVFFKSFAQPAEEVLAALRAGESVDGDRYWMGNTFEAYGETMVAGVFGADFHNALKEAQTGVWQGPIASARGQHFFIKQGTDTGSLASFAEVRSQIEQDYWAAQTRDRLDGVIAELQEKYDVRETL
ncbi:MAG: peptidylprolyl isomerase [Pseudomonadota bacterium]